ncbi:hypothetical protein J8273_6000 [Carpediemonas membranifera]|uniref:Uncharacterized protein n=1 Tax=Carpediemonas membranifera TaxID=201153 RepID=A0A8J6B047_9EUKA|nr:hypothetical protein J8273_6000 [Carpediemonas membranifera]|eukprot:KAG9392643.1 hypothetical protein J8273_6000 [Carpediemonas membranifera]
MPAFIDAIKAQETPKVEQPIAILMIILNIIPLPGLGTMIAAFAGDDSNSKVIGLIQLLLCIPWFLVFIIVAWIPFIGQVIWLLALGTWALIHLFNVIFGVYWGIITFTHCEQQ